MNSLEKIFEDLLSASAGELSFETLIHQIVTYLGAGGGIIFEMNRKSGEIVEWATPTLIIGEDGYNDHLNQINPRMRFSLQHAPGHVAYEGRFISEKGIDRHEFYDWLGEAAGFRHFLGLRICDYGDYSLFHSVEFSKSHGHPDTHKIEAFKRIAPAVGQAWRLRKRIEDAEGRASTKTWLPEHLPWSIYALSRSGTITGMNESGRKLLEQKTVLRTLDEQLHAVDKTSNAQLQSVVKSGLAGISSELLVRNIATGTPFVVQVFPIDPLKTDKACSVAATVYVRDPLSKPENIGTVLGSLYGFTLAEQKLANVLANGTDITSAANELGLSRNTVRNRLQSMYAKTNTKRQSDFLVRILGILEP